jgi:hypothetical protein
MTVAVAVNVLVGCTPLPLNRNPAPEAWISTPETRIVSNEIFDAYLSPVCSSDGCYYFVLGIKNKSNNNIEIDWKKTLYISNKLFSGGFMLDDIDCKSGNKQNTRDIVLQKGYLFISITPIDLVWFKRKKYGTHYHRSMDGGINGVYLSTVFEGREIIEILTVNISDTRRYKLLSTNSK